MPFFLQTSSHHQRPETAESAAPESSQQSSSRVMIKKAERLQRAERAAVLKLGLGLIHQQQESSQCGCRHISPCCSLFFPHPPTHHSLTLRRCIVAFTIYFLHFFRIISANKSTTQTTAITSAGYLPVSALCIHNPCLNQDSTSN